MKIVNTLAAMLLSVGFLQAQAQTETPKGFTKGRIILADSTIVAGFVKETMRRDASVSIITETGGKKKTYHGHDLIAAEINGTSYVCVKGDFFKVISKGKICFLQKSSDASGVPTYNGTEAVFSSGTEGQPGDYFIYDDASHELKIVTKKTLDSVVAASFGNCTEAIDKAKSLNGNIAQLKEAVDIYNTRNNN